MNCIEFERQLWSDRETGGLAIETQELLDHITHCEGCRAEWDRARLLSDAIVDWRERIPEVDLAGAVLAAHVAQSRPRVVEVLPAGGLAQHARQGFGRTAKIIRSMAVVPGRSGMPRSRLALWMGIVGLVVLCAVGLFSPTPQPDGAPGHLALSRGRPASSAAGTSQGAAQDTLVTSTSHVYAKLAETAAGALGQVTHFVIPGPEPKLPGREPAARESSTWIEGFPYELGPIRRSVGDAFDFLWKAGDAQRDSRT